MVKETSTSIQFPWEQVKAESMRAVCRELGFNHNSTRSVMTHFLESVSKIGREDSSPLFFLLKKKLAGAAHLSFLTCLRMPQCLERSRKTSAGGKERKKVCRTYQLRPGSVLAQTTPTAMTTRLLLLSSPPAPPLPKNARSPTAPQQQPPRPNPHDAESANRKPTKQTWNYL